MINEIDIFKEIVNLKHHAGPRKPLISDLEFVLETFNFRSRVRKW